MKEGNADSQGGTEEDIADSRAYSLGAGLAVVPAIVTSILTDADWQLAVGLLTTSFILGGGLSTYFSFPEKMNASLRSMLAYVIPHALLHLPLAVSSLLSLFFLPLALVIIIIIALIGTVYAIARLPFARNSP